MEQADGKRNGSGSFHLLDPVLRGQQIQGSEGSRRHPDRRRVIEQRNVGPLLMARAALAAHRQETRQTQIDALSRTDVLLGLLPI